MAQETAARRQHSATPVAFTLDLTHPLLGQMIRQTVLFRDTKETMP